MIYLLGMPGCGKTTLGEKLSERLDLNFVDLDSYIEDKAGMSIPQIFSSLGESKFRALEKQAVLDSTLWKDTVVACGGGAPCFYDNIDLMNKAGKTIYINVSAEELHRRLLEGGQSKRPLLKDKTAHDLFVEIQQKKATRDAFYLRSQVIFYYDDLKVETLVDSLKKLDHKITQ